MTAGTRAALADEVIAGHRARRSPEYRRPLEGSFGRGLRAGRAPGSLAAVPRPARPSRARPRRPDAEVYRGAGPRRAAGRAAALDALQAAYRLGARVSWRRLSAVARERGADAELRLRRSPSRSSPTSRRSPPAPSRATPRPRPSSPASASAAAGASCERLVDGRAARGAELASAPLAEQAGWPLPEPPRGARLRDAPTRAPRAGLIGGGAIGRRRQVRSPACSSPTLDAPRTPSAEQLVAAAPSRPAGHAVARADRVPWTAARRSFARARDAVWRCSSSRLACSSERPDSRRPTIMLELLVHRDPDLAGGTRRAQPRGARRAFAGRRGERLEQTLLAWLEHRGRPRPRPPSFTSTARPSATASPACASCFGSGPR